MPREYKTVEDPARKAIIMKAKEGGNGWISFAKELASNGLLPIKSREKTVKVTAELSRQVLEAVDENPSITLKSIRGKIGNALSTSTIDRILDGSLMTLKLVTPVPIDKNNAANIAKSRTYCQDYQTEIRKKVHIDESNYNLWTRRSYARSVVGERAKRKERTAKGRNLNILLAISDDGNVVHHEIHVGSVTDKFRDFMGRVSAALNGENVVIYMDNAPIHKKLANFQLLANNLEVRRFDSPYSPELNPCDGCFSVIKAYIKEKLSERDPITDRQRAEEQHMYLYQYRENMLRGMCDDAMQELTTDKIRAMYRLSGTWVNKGSQGVAF
ncbi:conserved hypothetical protein [Perkinsus marinus ATCC 50983]|uniref:Tc1-like transposase DDE domain-containing protein n=1 Tax=Perkinsus marinus (strain ATCC 50983 / TXsc) TaxID=423536 RepID=C5LUG0_PERM5|nr:conserved hypothetical protein [Perkinsus marinus ATCC 50983]EEQ99693.1 conserved hypothetical protein [Perkinsus marinus ATCC 50983]|eukprot:XP_002766976.1 conserved hypothetical protein [Perkinsus marinus ATCC 50983]